MIIKLNLIDGSSMYLANEAIESVVQQDTSSMVILKSGRVLRAQQQAEDIVTAMIHNEVELALLCNPPDVVGLDLTDEDLDGPRFDPDWLGPSDN